MPSRWPTCRTRDTCTATTCGAAGRVREAIAEFEAADRLHREYIKREQIPAEYDWHFEHNLGLLATSLQYAGQLKRAEALLKAAFALPTGLLVQAYNKREWPMFLRARGRLRGSGGRGQDAHRQPAPRRAGDRAHRDRAFVALAANRWADAGTASNTALKLLRSAPGGAIAANALLALQGEFHLRTAAREKARATLDEVAKRLRAAPGPDAWAQALFSSTPSPARRARLATGSWPAGWRDSWSNTIRPTPAATTLSAWSPNTMATRRRPEPSSREALKLWAKADPRSCRSSPRCDAKSGK